MKTQLTIAALLVALANALPAAPLAFSEVSLLVRMRESDAYITQQLTQRRLLRALTPEQEAKLKAEGSSDRLLQALRDPAVLMPAADATAFENWSTEQQHAIAEKIATQTAEEEAHRVAQAEQAAAEAAWMRQQQEIIAREKARAEAAAEAADHYATSYPDFYGSYGGGYGYGGGYPIAPGRPTHPIYPGGKVPSGGALIWGNGTSTAPNSPGLNYYPLGSNGSNVTPGPTAGGFSGSSSSGGRSGSIGHGGGGGGRGGGSGISGGSSGRGGGGGGTGSIGGGMMGGGGRGGR